MSDLIDRQAALNAFLRVIGLRNKNPRWFHNQTEREAFNAIKDLPSAQPVEDARAVCGECDAWNQYKNYPQTRWVPVTAETMPIKEGDYWVIDHRGQRALYVYNDTDSSREYWMRCVKAWVPNAGKGVAGMSDAVLKRCPFCGGEAKLLYCENGSRYSSNIYYPDKRGIVECKRCGITLPRVSAKASKAVELWNRRTAE